MPSEGQGANQRPGLLVQDVICWCWSPKRADCSTAPLPACHFTTAAIPHLVSFNNINININTKVPGFSIPIWAYQARFQRLPVSHNVGRPDLPSNRSPLSNQTSRFQTHHRH